jgi:deoxyribonuclease-4
MHMANGKKIKTLKVTKIQKVDNIGDEVIANTYTKPIIGHNVGTTLGYTTTADRAKDTGADVFQIFYRSSKSYKSFKRPDEQTADLKRKNIEYGKKMVIHSSYVINICQPPTDYRHYDGLRILIEDLDASVDLDSIGVIIHMGKNPDKLNVDDCKANYIAGICNALKGSDRSSKIVLETGCGCGSEVSTSIEELGEIRSSLPIEYRDRVSFCLDTCHMYAAGYQIDDSMYLDIFELEVDRCLGWENVSVVHLNDSKDPFNSRKDNHQDIGKGMMNFHGLMKFVSICTKYRIPMILETPCNVYNGIRFTSVMQMKLVRDYHKIMHDPLTLGPETQIVSKTNSHKEIDNFNKKKDVKKVKVKVNKA